MALRHSLMKEALDHGHGEPMESESSPARDVPFSGMLTPSHLFPGFMNPLAIHASLATNPSLFRPFGWPPTSTNVVTSTSGALKSPITKKKKKRDESEAPLSPTTSGSSPQSNGSTHEVVSSVKSEKPESREKVFTCGVCNRSFGYKHVLQNHERTHTGEKPFECPQCHKRFTRDHHLKTHMRLHTGEKPYHCTHCDRHFVQVANLRRHLRVHTGERPYVCEVCDARFSDSNQLKAHMLIHKGQKPFHCNVCDGEFRRRHHLMNHKCKAKEESVYVERDFSPQVFTPSPYNEPTDPEEIREEEEDEDHETILAHNNNSTKRIRERKSKAVIRYQRLPPPQLVPLALDIPEQTEPEDLSMSSSRVRHNNNNSHSESPNSEEDMYSYRHSKYTLHERNYS